MIWFKKMQGLDSSTLREIADRAGVEWDHQSIVYRGRGIGYANGNTDDVEKIQDYAQDFIGYKPVEIEEPAKPERAQE